MGTPSTNKPDRTRLFQIIKERSFRTGEFTLASGRKSNLYFNLKPTFGSGEGLHLAAEAILDAAYPLDPDFIGGLVFGATPVTGPIATKSFLRGRPIATFYVRAARKDHGTRELIEGLGPGETMEGKRVVVIDDVATTGGSILQAVNAVRETGGIVTKAIVLVDREEGAAEALKAEGIELVPIFRAQEFVGAE